MVIPTLIFLLDPGVWELSYSPCPYPGVLAYSFTFPAAVQIEGAPGLCGSPSKGGAATQVSHGQTQCEHSRHVNLVTVFKRDVGIEINLPALNQRGPRLSKESALAVGHGAFQYHHHTGTKACGLFEQRMEMT